MSSSRKDRHDRGGYSGSRGFGRSGWATAIVIGVLLLGFGVVWRAHQRAKFHELTAPVIPQTTSAPMPGGQEAILLSRVALANNAEPEFVSATVLPGIGMQLLQATVAGPDQPAQDLFLSPPLSDAARMPVTAVRSAPFHLHVGMHHLQEKSASDDLIAFAPASDAQNQTLVDGGQATGTFEGTEKAGVSATVEITLSGRQIDLIARATNSTDENRFVAFDWSPRFLAPNNNLDQLGLAIPSRRPAGTVAGASSPDKASGFSVGDGQPVGQRALDMRFSDLGHDFLSDGTYVRLQDDDRFVLRILGMGDSLRSVHATSDPSSHSLLLILSSMDTVAEPDQRDQTLRPHQTMQWHLRMDVQPVKVASPPDAIR